MEAAAARYAAAPARTLTARDAVNAEYDDYPSADALRRLREREYPWEARGDAVHLDHASIGVIPQRARDAVAAYNDKRAEMHAMRAEDFFPQLDRSRALIARLIGASADEIALTTNTSWGVNLAAYALPLGPGDIVLG
ncbi:MAG: hypothetical protein C0503_11050, partial [Gemmatimonas sp.]|nr:hypothetical protein [Gemmatimonas sp.]